MPDFGTIASRLGEIATGYLAGADKKASDNQKDLYNAIGLASKLGPATGLDVSSVPGIMSPDNPYSGTFGDISAKFADQYGVAQADAAYKRNLEEAKLSADIQMKDATLQNQRYMAQMSAQSRLDAAAIAAGSRGKADWSDIGAYRKQLPGMIMSKVEVPEGIDLASSDGQKMTSKLISDATQFIDAAMKPEDKNDPEKVSQMLDYFVAQYQPTLNYKDNWGPYNTADVQYTQPIDFSALRRARMTGDWSIFTKAQEAAKDKPNPNVAVTPEGNSIAWNSATTRARNHLSEYSGAAQRKETEAVIDALSKSFPYKTVDEIKEAIGVK